MFGIKFPKRSTSRNKTRKNHGFTLRNPSTEELEQRSLMTTGAFLDPGTKQLLIYGSNGNDNVSIGFGSKIDKSGASVSDNTITQVSIQIPDGSYINQDFPSANILIARYIGNGGNDLFQNKTSLAFTTAPQANNGTISTSLLYGSTKNNLTAQASQIGVFTADQTGSINVDYIFRGAGYNGSLGFYKLDGMNAYTPGSVAYVAEAVNRVVANGSQGFTAIEVNKEAAKFSGTTPWESDMNNHSNRYLGVKSFKNFAPGTKFAAILIPNGNFQSINGKLNAALKSIGHINIDSVLGSSERPLFSLPSANTYVDSNQMWGQIGDLDNHGSLFAFEDLRLDGYSDKDYNDLVFQVTGAIGVASPVSEIANPSRQFQLQPFFVKEIEPYTIGQEGRNIALNAASNASAQISKGIWTVDASGQVTFDFRYDGGGYQGEMAIFSLNGMENFAPGSPEFNQEASRRALSNTTLGRIVIRDKVEGAAVVGPMNWETSYSTGSYAGVKTFSMTPGDKFAAMLVPNGSVWQVFNSPSIGTAVLSKETKLRPLFSMPSANPTSTWGGAQMIDMMANNVAGVNFGWEDIRGDDLANCDRDFNDVIFRITGATMNALDTWANVPVPTNKKILKSTLASTIFI